MGRQYYKRGWHHTKSRGSESMVNCGFCGRKVPRYKTFPTVRGFRITDPVIRKELGAQGRFAMSLTHEKMYACPACARHRNIVRKKN